MASSRSLGPAPHRRVLELIRALPAVDVQNRLLRVTDKEIATALLYMAEAERWSVLDLLGSAKRGRIIEEMTRQQRSRIEYSYYETAIRTVIRNLEGANVQGARTYYRPRTGRDR
ncbi:MAG: hypothetical protein ACOC2V_04345 [Alkalispirochaeta sp.]